MQTIGVEEVAVLKTQNSVVLVLGVVAAATTMALTTIAYSTTPTAHIRSNTATFSCFPRLSWLR
jgi:hypothetical protein